jgi:REP element-mobilizing transposase RayT
MTRKREWYEGAAYHVTVRGNRRNDIFRDKEDFEYYLSITEEALLYYTQFNYKVICYCLMDNHVHLMIKTDKEPLGKLIGRISALYTRYFNKKYNYIGHLFQDRYFSELIKSDAQMIETSRYIHLNPVRANMVKKPEEYVWSSYSMFIGEKEEKLISSEKILSYFRKENKGELYKEFVERKIEEFNQ